MGENKLERLKNAFVQFERERDFEVTQSKDGVLVTNYTGGARAVVIPSVVGSLTVDGISDTAFFKNSAIESVVISEGIRFIADAKCANGTNGAFMNAGELVRVELPQSIESIGKNAFRNCSALSAVILPDKLQTISNSAFSYCTKLARVDFPSALLCIAEGAFQSCYALEKVLLPRGLREIENSAFYFCSHLLRVFLPKSLERVGTLAFARCEKLTDVYFEGDEAEFETLANACGATWLNTKRVALHFNASGDELRD